MSSPEQAAPDSSTTEDVAALRSDFLSALAWIALGIAILIGSVMMDRLESRASTPTRSQGCCRDCLGLPWRSWARCSPRAAGAVTCWRPPARRQSIAPSKSRILLVLGLCLTFGVVLVGHGLPFWFAAAIFVTTAILSLQYQQRKSTGQELTVRRFFTTAAIGLGAGIAITIVFQEIFLVRLP